MNSNYLYLMHESFPPLHLNFSPSFLHSKKPKVQPLILWENILRGCLASKKMKMKEKEKQSKALYIIYIDRFYILIYLYILQWMQGNIYIEKFFQPSQLRNLMVGGLQGEEWKFIQKYLKEKDLVWSWQNKGDFAPSMGWCEIRTRRGVVRISHNWKVLCEFRTSLEQLSSEGHIFLISAPNHTQLEVLNS